MKKKWNAHPERHESRRRDRIAEGRVQHHGNFAFLISETEGEPDVFLRGGLGMAMDGDRVQVRVPGGGGGRPCGEIVRVLKRARSSIVGVLRRSPTGWTLSSGRNGSPAAQVLGFSCRGTPSEGCFAVLKVSRWPSERSCAAGTVTELLGGTGDIRARITALLRERGIEERFTEGSLAQSRAFGARLEPSQWKGREELFGLPVFTIDGADAKDFDDAVSLEKLGGGMSRLGVHISDVGHYVKPGSALDREAYARATSVYLPDRVVPMLPPALSDNLCSLLPGEERLTVSVFMDVDRSGAVRGRRTALTVIRSCRRFTYEEAQALLDGKKVPAVPSAAAEAVKAMGALAAVLRRLRAVRGALDFDLPEYKVETDPSGRPLRAVIRPRLQSHRLIEEFMLLANEAAAAELMAARIPFLHRRHDVPDQAKMRSLAETLGELGITAGGLLGSDPRKGLLSALGQASGHPLSDVINSMIVRSMRQAVYSPESKGHFGIAARSYTHFTSPIRRYPDLIAHRALKSMLAGKRDTLSAHSLVSAGSHCSERERAAAEAEHKAVDLMRAELFSRRIGEEMDGVVTGSVESGVFVRLGDTGAEGLLRGARHKPGARLRVIVTAADPVEGKIDLAAAGSGALPAQIRLTRRSSPRKRR
ncbi:MAG TPA: VacB/RNase II family 3'-5' exoribonuclease [Elusimicrobiales bacterium]|nr:VacB/RNase II family 3'-5' exoribonuclease [Elusimicrobiales bacterium]